MKRNYVDYKEYCNTIVSALPKGILLTSKVDEKVNTMVIGWGTIGINWSKPVFVAYVRTGRYTRELLDHNPEFTINTPLDVVDTNTLQICGTKSGRHMDKIQECGLTLIDGEKVSVPAIKEFPLTLECKVIYRQEEVFDYLEKSIFERCYPQDVDSSHPSSNKDPHVMYFGEIVNAYIVE